MADSHDDMHGGSERRTGTTRSRDKARSLLDEPPLLHSPEDRWHNRMLVSFLALMLIVSVVGLVRTLVNLLR